MRIYQKLDKRTTKASQLLTASRWIDVRYIENARLHEIGSAVAHVFLFLHSHCSFLIMPRKYQEIQKFYSQVITQSHRREIMSFLKSILTVKEG